MNNKCLDKAFFGKDNCLKLQYNKEKKECYFHLGKTKDDKSWEWVKIKFNELELGDIVNLINGKKNSLAFYHSFGESKQQIWLNTNKDYFTIKTKEISKSLVSGEQTVVRVMLENIIWDMVSC